jgi:hypothetical protein
MGTARLCKQWQPPSSPHDVLPQNTLKLILAIGPRIITNKFLNLGIKFVFKSDSWLNTGPNVQYWMAQ